MLELASPVNTPIKLWHAYVDSLRKDKDIFVILLFEIENPNIGYITIKAVDSKS